MRIRHLVLAGSAEEVVSLPEVTKYLTVETINNQIHLWMLCDPSTPVQKRKLCLVGDINWLNITDDYKYVGSVVMPGTAMAFHVFDTALPQQVM